MLLSISILLLLSLALGELASRANIPSLVGMIVAGMVAGPYGLNLLCGELLAASGDIRTFALVVILMRVGFSMDLDILRRSGRSTVLLCFLPALFEIAAMVVIAPILFGISHIDAAIMGCVIAAVSPAIIVPKMIEMGERARTKGRRISQIIMAAASIDDLFVIVLFSIFMKMGAGGEFTPSLLLDLPLSLLIGVAVGLVVGYLLSLLFRRYSMGNTIKVTVLLSVAMLLVGLEQMVGESIPYSPLLSIITIGATIKRGDEAQAQEISNKYGKVWQVAQLLLFSLVGASVDIHYAWQSGGLVVLTLLIALLWRVVGVWISTLGGGLSRGERLFSMIAYTPKATVQAAIGAIPLTMGLECGELVLSMAVVAILITAPLGASAIDWGGKRLLD